MKIRLAAKLVVVVALCVAAPAVLAQDLQARVARVLKATPLIDGHNDWPDVLREREGEGRWTVDLRKLEHRPEPYDTDIGRLRQGMVGGQFWSVWVSPALPGPEQVKQTVEQIALVHSFIERYPDTFALARTAADVRRIHKSGRIASLIGVEGGGQIDGSLGVLRSYHTLGASYLTLTHSRTIDWADSATDDPKHDGLTAFGESVVLELNRLGMLVDLSHVSEATMLDALRVSRAPVIFSHSSARALNDHPRNVSDTVLAQLAANRGVAMVTFPPMYLSDAFRRWSAERDAEKARLNAPPYGGLYIGQPDKAAAALAEWERTHAKPVVTLATVADHIEHVVKIAGIEHVGIGADFDGMGSDYPAGLNDVSHYPELLAELMRRGWSDADVTKLAGGNILRVLDEAAAVAQSMERANRDGNDR
jgi:membrane dipeptidase